jgi:hypothetical protein
VLDGDAQYVPPGDFDLERPLGIGLAGGLDQRLQPKIVERRGERCSILRWRWKSVNRNFARTSGDEARNRS